MHENGQVAGWKLLPESMDGYDVEPELRRQRRLGIVLHGRIRFGADLRGRFGRDRRLLCFVQLARLNI